MFKRIVSFLTAAVTALAFTVTAAAESDRLLSVESYHSSGNTLYCFAHAKDEDGVRYIRTSVSEINGLGEEVQLLKADAESCTVDYMLLIDLSWTMQNHSSLISAFTERLMTTGQNVTVTVAGCGEEFTIEAEGLTSADEVRNAVKALRYSHEYSDIFNGVTDALDYISDGHTAAGGITNLILITDGDANLKESGTKAEALEAAAERTRAAVTGTPEVIVHAVGLGSWEKNAYGAVTSGTGLDLTVRNLSSAENSADMLNSYIDSLYVMQMPLYSSKTDPRFDISIRVQSYAESEKIEFYELPGVRNLNTALPAHETAADTAEPSEDPDETTDIPADDDPDSTTADTGISDNDESPEITDVTDVSETSESDVSDIPEETNAETAPADITSDTAATSDTTVSVSAEGTETTAGTPGGGPSGSDDSLLIVIVISAAAVVIAAVIAAVIIVLVTSKKKRFPAGTALSGYPAAPASGAVKLKLQIMSGNVIEKDIILNGQITIGSDAACDIVCGDATVTLHNSRIFLNSGYVYIEDLNERSNTTVGGMPITTPTLLSSGDEISVGRIRIRVFY